MERIEKIGLLEKFTRNIPDGTFFQAKNLGDLLNTLENHKLAKDEIIRIQFPNQIKLKSYNSNEYELPFYYNNPACAEIGEDLAQEYIDNGCGLISAIDNSINDEVFFYAHPQLANRFGGKIETEIILPKPFMTFHSSFGVGIGVFNDFK